MKDSAKYTLEQHEGEYAQWPIHSYLYVNGSKTKTKIPGYQLIDWFEVEPGFLLLIVDYDCPFEEQATVVLLSEDNRKLCQKRFPPGELLKSGSGKKVNPNLGQVEAIDGTRYEISYSKIFGLFWKLKISVNSVV